MSGMFNGVLGLVVLGFLVILAVLWFLLPFAIFGTKDKLAALIAESQRTNEALARIASELSAARAQIARTSLPDAVRSASAPADDHA